MGRSAKTGAPPLVVEVSAVTGSRHRIKLPAPVADVFIAPLPNWSGCIPVARHLLAENSMQANA